MAVITIDTDNLFTTGDLARRMDVQTSTARQWLRRHWNELPPPIISIPLGLPGRFAYVWTNEDGRKIEDLYRQSQAAWPNLGFGQDKS